MSISNSNCVKTAWKEHTPHAFEKELACLVKELERVEGGYNEIGAKLKELRDTARALTTSAMEALGRGELSVADGIRLLTIRFITRGEHKKISERIENLVEHLLPL